MGVYFSTDQLPDFRHAVLTIGTYDGVHKGHRAILEQVVRQARQNGGESVLLTFEPHPRKMLFPLQPLGIITPLPDKIRLLSEAGIDNIVVVPFTHQFSQLTAEEYVGDFIVPNFHPASVVIGYDHRFGNDRRGNIGLLEVLAPRYGFTLVEIPVQLIDAAVVSSTKIRRSLEEGKIEDAFQMLGRRYSISGIVVHGRKLGRVLGYPTANIKPMDGDQILPAIGVYAVRVVAEGEVYGGMLSIGTNPTITEGQPLTIEVNIFEFERDIYGDALSIEFVAYLRAEQKFVTLDALKAQLLADKYAAESALLMHQAKP